MYLFRFKFIRKLSSNRAQGICLLPAPFIVLCNVAGDCGHPNTDKKIPPPSMRIFYMWIQTDCILFTMEGIGSPTTYFSWTVFALFPFIKVNMIKFQTPLQQRVREKATHTDNFHINPAWSPIPSHITTPTTTPPTSHAPQREAAAGKNARCFFDLLDGAWLIIHSQSKSWNKENWV